ncbi:MAG TPA: response regulator [Desulfuromonadales bacterium]|nr:response regulator [Desulfuromonadales bacterium]
MDKRAHILIVDDEPINIRILSAALQLEYDVTPAYNGFDAIRLMKELKPDLIILDVMMPNLNGFEICGIIKSDPDFAEIPVIFLTAMDSAEAETQGLELGGIDYLTKPVNSDLLRLRVRNHIQLKERNDLVRKQRDLLARQKEELQEALGRIKRLEGIIPICMHCKSIRHDGDSWQQLEKYISAHTDAFFSHGVCPSCLAKYYPDVKKHA